MTELETDISSSMAGAYGTPYPEPGARALGWLCRGLVRIAARLVFSLDVVQHAPLPRGPKIIAPNHPSTTDPFLMTIMVDEQMRILIHDTLFHVPAFGAVLRALGHVPVVPGAGGEAFDVARAHLLSGKAVAVFPEGAISPLEGGLGRPRTGVARLALLTGAPVVPVGIHLVRERIRLVETRVDGKCELGTWYTNGPYAVTVGEPMRLEGQVEDRAHVRALSEEVMQRIASLVHESAQRLVRGRSGRGHTAPHPRYAIAPEALVSDPG
ncbi:MAG: 1-acyl-sn-glycerol-3-phosphate acyltransferase [Anaerolineae bacterium]|nr:1-acyl-sn-glycerol-3-phosphate acyltransferase [Anaerolineae bacterium]